MRATVVGNTIDCPLAHGSSHCDAVVLPIANDYGAAATLARTTSQTLDRSVGGDRVTT